MGWNNRKITNAIKRTRKNKLYRKNYQFRVARWNLKFLNIMSKREYLRSPIIYYQKVWVIGTMIGFTPRGKKINEWIHY